MWKNDQTSNSQHAGVSFLLEFYRFIVTCVISYTCINTTNTRKQNSYNLDESQQEINCKRRMTCYSLDSHRRTQWRKWSYIYIYIYKFITIIYIYIYIVIYLFIYRLRRPYYEGQHCCYICDNHINSFITSTRKLRRHCTTTTGHVWCFHFIVNILLGN